MKTALALMIIALAITPRIAAAQCWDCQVQYISGEDCYMDTCVGVSSHGYAEDCSQSGSCGNEECDTYGGACNPYMTSLDGRSLSNGLSWLSHAELRAIPGVAVVYLDSGEVFRLECTTAIAASRYTAKKEDELRAAAHRLVL